MMNHLLAELHAAGYQVDSISSLRRAGVNYAPAIPILLKWLPLVTSTGEKDSIVRALSVPWARPAAMAPLIEQFEQLPIGVSAAEEQLRWAIGNALEILWDDRWFDQLARIACDDRFGKAREMIVLGFAKSVNPNVQDVLIRLLDDDAVCGHAAKALGRLRPQEAARPGLEVLTLDRRAWIRKEAKNSLAKI